MNSKPNKKRIYLLLTLLASCLYLQAATYNVRDFGAKADGKTIDSPAINRAIEAAAQDGGGTIYLPAGEYACYSIRLKSNIHLYLEQGARIIAAFPGKEEGYDLAEPNEHNKYQDFGHSHWKNSLIWGIGLENITISGPGLIYGKGLTREESRLPGVGNKAISLKDCRNVTLERFLHAPLRTLRPASHRCGTSHPAEPESRYQPRWIRYRLLPQRTHQPMHGQFSVG